MTNQWYYRMRGERFRRKLPFPERLQEKEFMEWLAVVGLVIMTTSFVPQIIRIYRLKSARDISRWTFYQLIVVNLLFIGYYITLGHWTALVLNAILGVAMVWVLVLTFIYR